jgi:hypothetical protein
MRAGSVQLTFTVERCSVESVSIEGPGQSVVSAKLAAEMQNLVGKPYVDLEPLLLQNRLKTELPPGYRVGRRVDWGTSQRQVRVVFVTNRGPLLPFRGVGLFSNYRSTQGQSISLPLPVWCGGFPRSSKTSTGERCVEGSTAVFFVHLVHDRDDSVERDTGVTFTLESMRLGTDRLGAKLKVSAYAVHWADETAQATDALAWPDLYRNRHTVDASMAVAFTSGLYATVGLRQTNLTMRSPVKGLRRANAATGSLSFETGAGAVNARGNRISAMSVGYDIRAAAPGIGSDFVYARHLLTARFIKGLSAMGDLFGEVETGSLSLNVRAGRITGTAPLFDRFSIGNVDTLRGWNKFEIAPRGTTRIVHASLEYSTFIERCRCFRAHLFYDAGAGWNDGEPIRVRHSAGVGIGVLKGFMEIAFPLMRRANPHETSAAEMFSAPTFTVGLRHNISEILRW